MKSLPINSASTRLPIVARPDIVTLKPGKWVMEVEGPNASFLVISQTNYPGWHVSVNDEPAHLYQTNFPGRGRAAGP